MRWRIYVVAAVILAIMLASLLFVGDTIDRHFEGPEGLDRLRSYGGWAWLSGIGLIISDLILPVPSTTIIALLGMLYGPWLGGFIGGVGTLLAGLVAYGGCRLLGDRFVRFLVGEANLGRLQAFFSRHGLWAIALTRWMPLLPEALCCLAGMSRMRFWPLFWALVVGSFPMGFTFALLGQAYLDRPVTGMVISAMIPLVVWPPVHFLLRRRPARAGASNASADLAGLPEVRVTSDGPDAGTRGP